jgi:hypothetical protein
MFTEVNGPCLVYIALDVDVQLSWRTLALSLGLTRGCITAITYNNSTKKERVLAMLIAVGEVMGSRATLDVYAKALLSNQCYSAVDSLQTISFPAFKIPDSLNEYTLEWLSNNSEIISHSLLLGTHMGLLRAQLENISYQASNNQEKTYIIIQKASRGSLDVLMQALQACRIWGVCARLTPGSLCATCF